MNRTNPNTHNARCRNMELKAGWAGKWLIEKTHIEKIYTEKYIL